MALRVKRTPTDEKRTPAFYIRCVPPMGLGFGVGARSRSGTGGRCGGGVGMMRIKSG